MEYIKGSNHDSTAFRKSRLFTHIEQKPEIAVRQLFIVGDFCLQSLILSPHDSNEVDKFETKAKDALTYYLSSSRVMLELFFGQLVPRWRIIWRTLQCHESKSYKETQACMLLKQEQEVKNKFFLELKTEYLMKSSVGLQRRLG